MGLRKPTLGCYDKGSFICPVSQTRMDVSSCGALEGAKVDSSARTQTQVVPVQIPSRYALLHALHWMLYHNSWASLKTESIILEDLFLSHNPFSMLCCRCMRACWSMDDCQPVTFHSCSLPDLYNDCPSHPSMNALMVSDPFSPLCPAHGKIWSD